MAKEWDSTRLAPGADPYISWSLGPGRDYFLAESPQQPLLQCILQLTDITPQELAKRFQALRPTLRIPALYLEAPKFLQRTSHISGIVSTDFFDYIAGDEELREKVAPLVLGPPLAPGSLCSAPEAEPTEPPTGEPEAGTVVVGVIDDGIAFGHERFRIANGETRVEYVWLQDGPGGGPGSAVDYGREHRKRDLGGDRGIDSILGDCTTAGFLDEDKFYRVTEAANFARAGRKSVARRLAHGTHVMDLASGFDPDQNRTDRPIVAVQLPWRTTADTSGSRFDPFVLDGVRYILDRADRIAKQRGSGPLPVVINFSYGIIAGPHDGTSPLEAAIDQIVVGRKTDPAYPPMEVVIPAGNSHLSRTHSRVAFAGGGGTEELDWRVLPDDRTSSFLEVWLPYRPGGTGPSRLEIIVTPPGGSPSPPLGEIHGGGFAWVPGGHVLAWMIYQLMPWPTSRGRFFICLLPTRFLDPPAPVAPAGPWKVTIRNVSSGAIDSVHAWIQRDDTPVGYPRRGRQSYFDERCYVRFDAHGVEIEEDTHPAQAAKPCHVKRASLINAIATGAEVVVAGGYLRQNLRAARYSAGGPITPTRDQPLDPGFKKPDAMLVSDDSKVHSGVLAAGSRSGSRVAINGTSVAAPQLARWIADELAAGRPGDRNAVKAKAIMDEAALPAWKPPLPADRGGWGRMLRDSAFPHERYWDWD